jgi:peroxiredoxin Q/BCP
MRPKQNPCFVLPSRSKGADMKPWSSFAIALALTSAACSKSDPPKDGSSAPAPQTGLVAEGSIAPAIDTTAHTGEHVSLASLRGKPVVVYFYPKDDTPGCTKEACEIRDTWSKFKETGVVVLGVSTQDATSHVAFAEKYKLPFLLLPDPDGVIAKAYGVPLRMGLAKRVTFIIDSEGKIAKVFPDVTPAGHASEILAAISALRT